MYVYVCVCVSFWRFSPQALHASCPLLSLSFLSPYIHCLRIRSPSYLGLCKNTLPVIKSITLMAAPLLVMSTSSSTSQGMSRNPAPPGAEAQTRQDEAAPKPAGRGKRAAKPPAQKRPPQRGLGVAQLERLRQQEHWKKMTEMSQHQHLRGEFQFQAQAAHDPALVSGPLGGAPLHHCPADYCMGSPRPVACSGQMLGAGRGLGVQRGGSFPHVADRVVGSLYMAGVGGSTAALEPPRELSSMPNVRCFSDHCDICSRLKVRKLQQRTSKKKKRMKRVTMRYRGPFYCFIGWWALDLVSVISLDDKINNKKNR